MAEFTHIELRMARESRKIPRWKLANAIGVSEDTLERWETGKAMPHPDDVSRIEQELEITNLWHNWMLSNYDSYRARYSDAPQYDLFRAVVHVRQEIQDVLNMQDTVERDAITGAIDDPDTRKRYRKELEEAQASITNLLGQIPKE